MSDDELDTILNDLKNDESVNELNNEPEEKRLDINDDNVGDYVMQKVGALVESGINTVQSIQQTIESGFEPEELTAFNGLMTAVTNAANTLNKIHLQNKKDKAAKDLKKIDIEAKKQIASGGSSVNNNVLIATREEVIQKFLEDNKKAIDVEYKEEKEEKDDE